MRAASEPEEIGPAPRLSAARSVAERLGLSIGQLRVAVVVPIVCLALVLALRLWLKWVGPTPGDVWSLGRNDYGFQSAFALDVGNFFQVIGTGSVAAITIAWAAVFVLRSDGWRGVAFLVLASSGIVFNAALKRLSGPTPLQVQRAPGGLNFPSGHTVYAVVVFGALAWLAYRHRRFDIVAVLVFLTVLMGPFRVVLGAHFPSDVVAAYLVGLAWLVPVAIFTGFAGRAAPRRAT